MPRYQTSTSGQRNQWDWWHLLLLMIILLSIILVTYDELIGKKPPVMASKSSVDQLAETLLFAGSSISHGCLVAPHFVSFQAPLSPLAAFCMAYPYFFYAGASVVDCPR